eukprot:1137219-Pleurochrysis_carterae.AAC.1
MSPPEGGRHPPPSKNEHTADLSTSVWVGWLERYADTLLTSERWGGSESTLKLISARCARPGLGTILRPYTPDDPESTPAREGVRACSTRATPQVAVVTGRYTAGRTQHKRGECAKGQPCATACFQ